VRTWTRQIIARVLSWMPQIVLAAILPPKMGIIPRVDPPPLVPPNAGIRLYIARANSAGQSWQWARAAERNLEDVGAVSMSTESNNMFRFPVDNPVPLGAYRWSRRWQRAQFRAVSQGFTHVLVESGQRLFGDVFPGSLAEEVQMLQAAGVKVAMVCHGSDIRLPSRHVNNEPWSPFRNNLWEITPALEKIALRNARAFEVLDCSVFVSTPDLLLDVPSATWLPVVVDVSDWSTPRKPFDHAGRPRVAHVPSKAVVKGSDLIDPILTKLAAEGLVDYVRVEAVPSSEMRSLYTGVDIVLDQFRIGNYGVAACEAMAAGRLVVSHVSRQVRDHVHMATGRELPIVEATADTLEDVLRTIVARPHAYQDRTRRGLEFVTDVHDGRRSADALRDFLTN
jgi:hypothetical protein